MPKTLKSVDWQAPASAVSSVTKSLYRTQALSNWPDASASLQPRRPLRLTTRYHPDRVFKLKHRQNHSGEPVTSLSFCAALTSATAEPKTALFCFVPNRVAGTSDVACWNAGMRIPKGK